MWYTSFLFSPQIPRVSTYLQAQWGEPDTTFEHPLLKDKPRLLIQYVAQNAYIENLVEFICLI